MDRKGHAIISNNLQYKLEQLEQKMNMMKISWKFYIEHFVRKYSRDSYGLCRVTARVV